LSNYSKLKELSERNKDRILEAKIEREKLGGEHYHKFQCDCIPESFSPQDCVHLEPCYKKFTLILAGQSSAGSNESRRSSTRQPIGEIAWTYPDVCNICKLGRRQFKGKKVTPVTITSFQAEKTIKAAAKAKNPEMYNEIADLDLISKEFKMHDHCRKTFLKGFGEKSREKSKSLATKVSSVDYVLGLF